MDNSEKSTKETGVSPSKRRLKSSDIDPWLFNGVPFTQDMVGKYAGFVYLIICPDGRHYIGKKFFWSMRKPAGAKRRKKQPSDWERYFSSSDVINQMVREQNPREFQRIILSLHELERDVSYCEVREQWRRDVLETKNPLTGERVYLNDNIQGKFYPGLYADWKDRSLVASS